jgi:hypothetical protein
MVLGSELFAGPNDRAARAQAKRRAEKVHAELRQPSA